MPSRQEKIAALIQSDADEAKAMGYESTGRVHEQRLADYRAATGLQQDSSQQSGQQPEAGPAT